MSTPETDDMVDALRYAVEAPVDPAALLAVVFTAGVFTSLNGSLKTLTIISVFGMLATAAGARLPPGVGGWFASLVMLVGLSLGTFWLMYKRRGQRYIARALIERFGEARFRKAQYLVDRANQYIDEV